MAALVGGATATAGCVAALGLGFGWSSSGALFWGPTLGALNSSSSSSSSRALASGCPPENLGAEGWGVGGLIRAPLLFTGVSDNSKSTRLAEDESTYIRLQDNRKQYESTELRFLILPQEMCLPTVTMLVR